MEYEFIHVPLVFGGQSHSEPFSKKNNKTVLETLQHRRYSKMRERIENSYPHRLHEPLGSFLLSLKENGDTLYRLFLNKYGDEKYSLFQIDDKAILENHGIYAYKIKDELKYIGRCRDSMRKRVNQGYGKIHPKNCYIDGQTTNCHLNSRITTERELVSLWFCELDLDKINRTEQYLITEHQPPWNIQRGC